MNNAVQTSAAWFHAAPEVAQVAVVAAAIAFLSMIVATASMLVSWRQAKTGRTTLFASLLEKRVKWLDDFRDAVKDRHKEINDIPAGDAVNHALVTEPEALFRVNDAKRNAHWLFDKSVAGVVNDIVQLLEQRTMLIINARSKTGKESMDAAQMATKVAFDIEAKWDTLYRKIKPFMYVGDVKNPSREARGAYVLKGMTFRRDKNA